MAGVTREDKGQSVRFSGGEGKLIRVRSTPHGRMAIIRPFGSREVIHVRSKEVEVIK